jgi:predicted HAD superfamily Cof-like phosphohydrolase
MINEIYEFNRKVLGVDPRQMVLPLDLPEEEWLIAALKEEIQEYEDANNLPEKVDALIDLCYFAIGGLIKLGLNEEQTQDCFDAVHRANMTKKSGINNTRPNDGSIVDAIKDENFQDPTEVIKEIINGRLY